MHKLFFEPPQYQNVGKHAYKSKKIRSDNEEIAIDKVARAIIKRIRKNKRFLELYANKTKI